MAKWLVIVGLAFRAVSAAQTMHAEGAAHGGKEHAAWVEILKERLPVYGHRNWIVVADSAYPDQSRDGIETVVAHENQLSVLKTVLALIDESKHVRPIIYTDQELPLVDESDAPGITDYRDQLASILNGQPKNVLPHEQIIAKLDDVSKTFRVLIIKTTLTIPYTSVFLQLDCAYWPADAESRLRAKMAAQSK
ncbi:MAG TPA: hypothetical protein VHZ07_06845 [Bryobacteraceae bacterium]|jgi:hypothetical protein|nr:hypothetical protein [Bryobacteraceae bacterium]